MTTTSRSDRFFLDIETASDPFWLLKQNPKNDQDWILANAAKGATHPVTGCVTAIAIALNDGSTVARWVSTSIEEEAEVLAAADKFLAADRRIPVVGHNIVEFDAPFLRFRALKCGVHRLAQRLHQEKPWSGSLEDTFLPPLCPRGRQGKGWTLTDLAEGLGLSVPPSIPGSEAPAAWYRGEFDEIEKHVVADVEVLRSVYSVLRGGVV